MIRIITRSCQEKSFDSKERVLGAIQTLSWIISSRDGREDFSRESDLKMKMETSKQRYSVGDSVIEGNEAHSWWWFWLV